MTVSAAISLSASTANPNQQVTVTLTITNSGGSAVTVTSIQPNAATGGSSPPLFNVPVTQGQPPIGPSENVIVPASGTLSFTYPLTAFATQGISPWSPKSSEGPGSLVVNNQKVYRATNLGQGFTGGNPGPTGTGTGITDGSVTWDYVSAAPDSSYDIGAFIGTSDGSYTNSSTANLKIVPPAY